MKGVIRMKKVLLFTVCLLLMAAGAARADLESLNLGGTYSSGMDYFWNGTAGTTTGGSIDPSSLNGASLPWVYCVDIIDQVYVPVTYASTQVSTTGYVNGSMVNNAGLVAYLLTYAKPADFQSGQGYQAEALQAAIWTIIYDGNTNPIGNPSTNYFQLNTSASPGNVVTLYDTYLNAVKAYAATRTASTDSGYISQYFWLSPGDGSSTVYQGLVTTTNNMRTEGTETPIPGTVWLFGPGLAGLIAFKRKYLG
jgi:hypothetical protein